MLKSSLLIDWRVAAKWYKRMNGKREKAGPLAHVGEIGPSFGKIRLGYERDRLHNLRTNGLSCGLERAACWCKLWLEGFLVGERDRVFVLESPSETVHHKNKLTYIIWPHSVFKIHAAYEVGPPCQLGYGRK